MILTPHMSKTKQLSVSLIRFTNDKQDQTMWKSVLKSNSFYSIQMKSRSVGQFLKNPPEDAKNGQSWKSLKFKKKISIYL